MITNEEFERIKKHLEVQVSDEQNQSLIPSEEYLKDTEGINKILVETDILRLGHALYHMIEAIAGCAVASNSICVKLFLAGYKCHVAMEQEKELEKLFTNSNS